MFYVNLCDTHLVQISQVLQYRLMHLGLHHPYKLVHHDHESVYKYQIFFPQIHHVLMGM